MDTNYFRRRASVRRYTAAEVTDALLRDIVADAAQAPNTGNMQLYSVVATRSPEVKEALAPAHFGQPAVTGAAVVLTVCADVRRYGKWCALAGVDPGTANLQALTYAGIDAVIFAQQLVTAAEVRGLGTCYMGTTTYNAPLIAGVLRLPQGVVPVATVTMGWPDESPAPSDRLPLEAILHTDTYHDPSDTEVAALYAPKEQLTANADYVAINGCSSLAEVYATKRYRRADNEHFSRVLRECLKAQGFNIDCP